MALSSFGARISPDASSVTFRVRAAAATRIELWTYPAAVDAPPVVRQAMRGPVDGVFELTLPMATVRASADETIFYGYRAWGPNWRPDAAWRPGSGAGFVADVDAYGHRFNPNKLLLDPYALEVSHAVQTPAQPLREPYLSGPDRRMVDTGPFAPKGIVIETRVGPELGSRPTRHLKDDVIYEVHLRGLTKADQDIPEAERGTYAGAARKAAYLRDLGVTAVEFQPVHQGNDALNDDPAHAEAHNYWGYQSMSYFAPNRRFAADSSPGGPTREWRDMVRAFHAAGLKVFVDVVYNHHEEGGVDPATGHTGTIYSLRGLDNAGYYETRRSEGLPQFYRDDNGVGPNLNAASVTGRDLVLDSLSYWAEEMGVDGFRFDLGAVLGNARSDGGFAYDRDDPDNILNRALTLLPERPLDGGAGIDLIAEPYTASGAGWELGAFPRGWAEWNTFFRDAVRASQNKLGRIAQTPAQITRRLAGSDDLFGPNGRAPWASINFVTCHDGFCLHDLHAYDDRDNGQPYPYGPSDGGNSGAQEMCWAHGGDETQQLQAERTSLALVLLAAGVPMIAGGSEFRRTQHGNDNAYNLDTSANWLDWTLLARNAPLHAFTRALIRFRLDHPALRPAAFFTGRFGADGMKDIAWLRPDGHEMDPDYLTDPENHFVAWQLDGRAAGDAASRIYVAYNGWIAPVVATLPAGCAWRLAIDTSAAACAWDNAYANGAETPISEPQVTVDGRSLLVAIG